MGAKLEAGRREAKGLCAESLPQDFLDFHQEGD
jgi:hypothetical protein